MFFPHRRMRTYCVCNNFWQCRKYGSTKANYFPWQFAPPRFISQRAQAIDRSESRNTVRNTLRARFQKLIHDLDPSAWYRVRLLFGPRRTDAQADQAQCFPVLCGDTYLRVWCGKHKGLSARSALPCESGLLSVFYHSHSPQHVIQSLRFTITFFEYRTLSKRAANPSPGTK